MHDNLCRRNICNCDPSGRACGLVNYRLGYAEQNIQRCADYQRLWGKYGQRQWIGRTFITGAKGMGMTDFGYLG